MTAWWRAWVLFVVLSVAPTVSAAEPLTVQDVLASVDATHPDLEIAERGVEAAAGRSFGARGGFDPVLSIRGRWNPVGYYPNTQLDAYVKQATPLWGAAFFAGYRLGRGSFPVYKGELETLSAGEVRAGVEVPVWRGGPIDDRRARIAVARSRYRGAEAERDTARLQVHLEAVRAYWDWVAAGQRVEVAEELLEIAQQRGDALLEQVQAGAIEPLALVDNRRLILEREAKLVAAEQTFQEAAIALSLFLRDDAQRPVQVQRERVPTDVLEPTQVDVAALEDEIERAIARRPELATLSAEREAARVGLRLAKNQRAPQVDLQSYVAKDFGRGPASLVPVEWGAGVVIEMPLGLRGARGELRAAKAVAEGIDAELRKVRDRVAAEVHTAHVSLRAAWRSAVLAREQLAAARELAAAERVRFGEGSSDLVVVNLRELAAAEAGNLVIDTRASLHRAHAEYRVAKGLVPVSADAERSR